MPGHRNIDNSTATCVLSYVTPLYISRRNRVLVNAGLAGATAWQDPSSASPCTWIPTSLVSESFRNAGTRTLNHAYSPSNTL